MTKNGEIIVGIAAVAAVAYFAFGRAGVDVYSDDFAGAGGDDSAGTSAGTSTGIVSSISNAGSSLATTIVSALSSFENVAASHNNPGGLCGGYDANGQCTGPATFSTLAEGQAKAEALVQKFLASNPGITLAAFVKKWSGGTGSVLQNYVDHVSDDLDLDPNDPIANAGAGDDATDDGSDWDMGDDVGYA